MSKLTINLLALFAAILLCNCDEDASSIYGWLTPLEEGLKLQFTQEGNEVTFSFSLSSSSTEGLHIQHISDRGIWTKPLATTSCRFSSSNKYGWAVLSICDSEPVGILQYKKKSYELTLAKYEEDIVKMENFVLEFSQPELTSQIILLKEQTPQTFEPNELPVARNPRLLNRPAVNVPRSKRSSLSAEIPTIEIAVFADEALYKLVKNTYINEDPHQKLASLLLLVIDGVEQLYNDESLQGINIKFKTVLIAVMDSKVSERADGDIDDYLEEFCLWQKKQKESSGDWDYAILLSGEDLRSSLSVGKHTVGLSYVGGLCTPTYSCSVSEGMNFASSVYTVAHETGHSFGILHDISYGDSRCPSGEYIMSSTSENGLETWSPCSYQEISDFLSDSGRSACLNTFTSSLTHSHEKTEEPEIPNFDEQCQMAFGPDWFHHVKQDNQEPCYHLLCANDSYWAETTSGALEGTVCGTNKRCHDGECIDLEDLNENDEISEEENNDIKAEVKEEEDSEWFGFPPTANEEDEDQDRDDEDQEEESDKDSGGIMGFFCKIVDWVKSIFSW